MGNVLIDLEVAKEYVQANYQGDPLLRHLYLTLLDALPKVEADHLTANGATIQRWISVEEQLPPTVPCNTGTAYSEAVNILTAGRKVLTAIWNGEDFIADAEFWEAEDETITHWTPVLLPLPKMKETI